jgi:hypothetical protein
MTGLRLLSGRFGIVQAIQIRVREGEIVDRVTFSWVTSQSLLERSYGLVVFTQYHVDKTQVVGSKLIARVDFPP